MNNYIISEEELKELEKAVGHLMFQEYSCSYCYAMDLLELLKSHQPVELVAEGEVMTKIFDGNESYYVGEGTNIGYWIAENHEGQDVKIYLAKDTK